MHIREKQIGNGNPVYIIAEIGSNHDQDIEQAKQLIKTAADAGTDAVKFQLFDTDQLYKKGDQLYDIFKEIQLNPEWIPELHQYANQLGQAFIISPFDSNSLEIVRKNNIDAIKWASSETVKLPLLKKAASLGKPLIISTGMCNLADVYEATEVCFGELNHRITLLHCISLYPTAPDQVNIRAMETLQAAFTYPVGYSDHTLDHTASILAVARGACIIEKHITLDRKLKGPDHFYAMEPNELKTFIQLIRNTEQMFGSPKVEMHSKEREVARREGLYLKADHKKGDLVQANDLEIKRPAVGIDKRFIETVIGSTVNRDLNSGDPIKWSDILINNN